MMVAHLPAGYLLSKLLALRLALPQRVVVCGMLGAIAPDLDMLLFYWDKGDIHHHSYAPHWPIFWLASCLIISLLTARNIKWRAAVWMFHANALLHIVLDSLASPIAWFQPLYRFESLNITWCTEPIDDCVRCCSPWTGGPDPTFTATEVYITVLGQPVLKGWHLNFLTDWTFALEVLLLVAAISFWWFRGRRTQTT